MVLDFGFGISPAAPVAALLLAALAPARPLALLERSGVASDSLYLTHLFAARIVREAWMRLSGPVALGGYVVAAAGRAARCRFAARCGCVIKPR